MATATNISVDQIQQVLDNLLVKRLREYKEEIIQEIKTTVSDELEEICGEIHDKKNENAELKKRVEHLEAASLSKTDAKIHAVNNDQYARRHMVVYGITLRKKQDPGDAVINVINTHLVTTLERSAIEICHPLGRDTNNKKRPLIVKFRYRDVKWNIMKKRKDLKSNGIVFAEDLCNDMKTLFEEVGDYEHVDTAWAWNGKSWVKTSLGKSTSSGMQVSGNSNSLNLTPLWTLMNLPQSPQTAIVMRTELSQVNTSTKFQWRRVIAGSHGPGAVFEAFLLRFGRLLGSIAAEVPIRLK